LISKWLNFYSSFNFFKPIEKIKIKYSVSDPVQILKIDGNYNSALSDYIDSLGVFPSMNEIDKELSYFSLTADYRINKKTNEDEIIKIYNIRNKYKTKSERIK